MDWLGGPDPAHTFLFSSPPSRCSFLGGGGGGGGYPSAAQQEKNKFFCADGEIAARLPPKKEKDAFWGDKKVWAGPGRVACRYFPPLEAMTAADLA